MKSLKDLPIELILDIIKEFVPDNENKPSVGNNAAWTPFDTYFESLKTPALSPLDENDPLPRSLVLVSIYSDLFSLRLTCSTLNCLCAPIIYRDLDVISVLGMPFNEWYDAILKPNAQFVKTIRLSSTDAWLTDEQAAKIIDAATNVEEILLYHPNFRIRSKVEEEVVGWWRQTDRAIMNVANEGRLRSFGIYSQRLIKDGVHFLPPAFKKNDEVSLLLQIAESPTAQKTLQRLDIVLWDISVEEYDTIRQNLTSLVSLTFFHGPRPNFGQIWSPSQHSKWAPNSNLTHLYLKRASGVYAPHIPHLVRHFTSLKYLLVSDCRNNLTVEIRPVSGWYQSKDALWRVREPLDTFRVESMYTWEIEAMAEIPTKILETNVVGRALVDALKSDDHYFPLLKTILMKFVIPFEDDENIFTPSDLDFIEDYCYKHGVALQF